MRCVLAAFVLVLGPASLPRTIQGQALPQATPETVGISLERLARVDALFSSYISEGRMAGAVVAIARRGKLIHFRGLGRMDVDEDRPMREDAIFRIASMTKPITSAAVLMLYEQGHFQLEDPAAWYIPELASMAHETDGDGSGGDREMTVQDLLTHTAGLPRGDPRYSEVMRNPEFSLKDKMEGIGVLPLAYRPGTEWRYSSATTVLGYLVEAVSGMPFEDFLEQRIFQPLGMVDTAFFVDQTNADRVPSAYSVNAEGVTEERSSGLQPRETRPPRAPNGSGGLFSTATDYLRFSQMLLNGGELDGVRLLGRKTVELMTTDHLPPGVTLPITFSGTYRLEGYGFGLGVRVRTDLAASKMPGSLGEYGWGGAYGTYFLIDPQEELVALFMPQLLGSGFHPIRRQFNNAVYQTLVN